jgi:hypothetical protein
VRALRDVTPGYAGQMLTKLLTTGHGQKSV